MAYTFLDNSLNTIGVLTNKGGQTNDYWGDSITHEIATSQDVLTSVSLSVDKPSVNIDTSGNQKTWNHVIQGLSFSIDGIGRKVNENDYLIYQEGTNGKYYLMAITQVDESAVQSGFHYKTVQGLNAAAYDLSRKTLRAKSFAQIPDNTQEKGTAQNILKYIFDDINWDVRIIGSFGAIDYDIAEGTTAQAVLLDIIGMFEAEVDAYVQLNNWGKGSNVFNRNGSIKRIFDFSTSIGKYRGETVRYNKNMVSITKTGARDSMYTKLYVNGNNITIADVNNGADFIVDDVANRKYNKLGSVSTPVTYLEGIITNSAIESPTALLAWGKKQLKILNHPRYNYQISATNDDKVQLGDTVIIQDTHASDPIYLKSKVISKTVSLADPVNNSFIVGEFSPIVIGADNGLEDTNQIMQLVNQANQTAIDAQKQADENTKKIADTRTDLEKNIDDRISEAKSYSDELTQTAVKQIDSELATVKSESDNLSAKTDQMIADANSYADTMYNNAVSFARTEASKALSDANTALDEAKSDLTDGIASEASERQQAVQTVNSQAQSYAEQAKSDAIAAAKTADGVVRKDFKTTTDSLSSTITQNKQDSDGKISTAQSTATQALNGLETKVSQTDYDKKTGDLSTKVNTVTQTATETKNELANVSKTVDSQSAKINTISNTVDGTTQTISDIQTEQGKQSGSIATLQSRADGFDATVTKVNNLSVGSRNLLLNSATFNGVWSDTNGLVTNSYQGLTATQDNKAWRGPKYSIISLKNREVINEKDTYIFSVWLKNTSSKQVHATFYGTNNISHWVTNNNERVADLSPNSDWVRVSTSPFKFVNLDTAGPTGIRVEIGDDLATGYFMQAGAKLEKGTIATDWSPAPEDLSSATAKAQLTADNATLSINNYKTDADGRIKKAQADIEVNANAITQKVSQSDYDKKTGDLTSSVNKAQSTADTATQTIGTYKDTNDRRVASAETKIKANSDAIKLTVSKTDYDNNNSQLDTRFTKVEATANGASTTVGKLQTAVNNLGQINQLFNTEFSPDFAGWYNLYPNPLPSNTITTELTKVGVDGFGSNVVSHKGGGAWLSSGPIAITQGTPVSISARVSVPKAVTTGTPLALYVMAFDSSGNRILSQGYNIPVNQLTSTPTTFKYENRVMPSNATQVYYICGWNVNDEVYISQPMLVFDDHIGDYVQGNYNNNAALAQVKITADSVSSIVSDPTTGLSTRVQKAEGTLSTVTGADIPALQKATFWQPYSSLNFNDYTKQGSFFFNTTSAKTNGPTTSTSWIYLIVEQGTADNSRIKQTAWYDGVNGVKITYARTLNSGTWSPWYANDNDSVTTISQTNDSIKREIEDRKTGDNNTLQSSKNFTTSSITKYDEGIQSQFTQTADAIMASVSMPNQLLNTEFNPDLEGWTLSADAGSRLPYRSYFENNINATTVGFNTASASASTYTHFQQTVQLPSTTGSGHAISMSWYSRATQTNNYNQLWVRFYDSSNTKLVEYFKNWADYKGNTPSGKNDWKVQNKWENITVPDKATSVQVSFEAREGTIAYLGHPMLVFGSTIGNAYMPGSYSGMNTSTVLSLFKDNWAIGISDNIGEITSGIVGNARSMSLISKYIVLDGNTTVTGDFYARGGNFKNLNAANITGDIATFIKSGFNDAFGSYTTLDAKGMQISTGGGVTQYSGQYAWFYNYNGSTLESIGRFGSSKSPWNPNNVDYMEIAVSTWRGNAEGGAKGNGGDGIMFAAYDPDMNERRLLTWETSLSAGYHGLSSGWNFWDNINFNGNKIIVPNAQWNVSFSGMKLSNTGSVYPSIVESDNHKTGIAIGLHEVYLLLDGKSYPMSPKIR